MSQMTEADVIKALECCQYEGIETCKDCPMFNTHEFDNIDDFDCGNYLYKLAFELINRQKAKIAELETQNNDLFYKLSGVMLSVDKWLEGKELKQDEVNRAITMREKTLQIVEKLEAEIERLKNFIEKDQGLILKLTGVPVDEYNNKIKSEAYREFAERLVDIAVGNWCHKVDVATITNTLKELTKKNDFKE